MIFFKVSRLLWPFISFNNIDTKQPILTAATNLLGVGTAITSIDYSGNVRLFQLFHYYYDIIIIIVIFIFFLGMNYDNYCHYDILFQSFLFKIIMSIFFNTVMSIILFLDILWQLCLLWHYYDTSICHNWYNQCNSNNTLWFVLALQSD